MNKIRHEVKSLINSILGAFGFELRRIRRTYSGDLLNRVYSLRSSLEDLLDHVVGLGFTPDTIIDVGVAYGTSGLYTRFPTARHILIEPLEEFEKYLQDICKNYNAEYILAAAGATPGHGNINVSSDLLGSSLIETVGLSREVPIVTLDNVYRDRNLQGPFVLKIDVQGAELEVLDGASTLLKFTELIILEVSFFRFSKGYPDFFDVLQYMHERGFVAYELFGGHNRPLDGARAQVDVVFVKEGGPFRTANNWATPEQMAAFHQLSAGQRI